MHPFHVPIYIKKKLKDFVEEFRTLLRLVLSFFACQIIKIDIYVNINPWDLFFSYAITGVINGNSFISERDREDETVPIDNPRDSVAEEEIPGIDINIDINFNDLTSEE